MIDTAKRILRIGFGYVLLVIGIVMMVAPGPGLLFIFLGLVLICGRTRATEIFKQGKSRLKDLWHRWRP